MLTNQVFNYLQKCSIYKNKDKTTIIAVCGNVPNIYNLHVGMEVY